jgi:hypothetical protein
MVHVKSRFFQHAFLVVLCLWLAFFLRVWGLDFGLPYKFHPDEDKYVDPALTWHTTGQMELEFINPPLFTYALTAADWLWFALVPFTPSAQWVTGAYVFARLWSVFFSMLTIPLAYVIGKRLHSRQAGLVALGLLSGLFLPAREAHFAVNDGTVAFFTLLAIYFSIRLFRQGQLSTYLAAGASVGLATAAKLTGGIVVLPLLLAHSLLRKKKFLYVILSLGMALAAFLAVSAHILGEWSLFVEAITAHLEFGAEGYKGLRMAPMAGWGFYGYVLAWGMGWPMLLAACLTLVGVAWQHRRQELVLAIVPVALFIYMGGQKIVFARFLLPAVPPLVVLVAIELVALAERWPSWQRHQGKIWSLAIGILLVQPLTNSIWFDHLLALPDTREVATQWFIEEFPQNTAVDRESYSILPSTAFLGSDWPYKLHTLSGSNQVEGGVDRYLARKAELVVLSNFSSGRVRESAAEEEMRLKQLALLDEKATLIKVFNPYVSNYDGWFYLDELYGPAAETLQRVRAGPLIKVYRLTK